MTITYTLAWIPMVFLAILNGLLRENVFRKRMSDLQAHRLSCLTGIAIFLAYTWLLNSIWPIETAEQAVTIGLLWLAMTVAFEFLFGHYVMHHSWSKLLGDYNVVRGRLWVLVLAAVAALPWVVFSARPQ